MVIFPLRMGIRLEYHVTIIGRDFSSLWLFVIYL